MRIISFYMAFFHSQICRGGSVLTTNDYDPTDDLQNDGITLVPCDACSGTGLAPEGWDCEECDGLGYWDF